MKVIKTDRRTSLKADLMEINVEGPSVENFTADHAIKLWWGDKTRRPNQKVTKRVNYLLWITGMSVSKLSVLTQKRNQIF